MKHSILISLSVGISFLLLSHISVAQSNLPALEEGKLLYEQGEYLRAQAKFDEARQACLASGDPQSVFECDLKLAESAIRLGNANEGLKVCVALDRQVTENSLFKAEVKSVKGDALINLGRNAEALENLLEAQSIFEADEQQNTSAQADCYNDLGIVYWNNGNNDLALQYLQQAQVMRVELHGKVHASVADSYNNIGLVNADINTFAAIIHFKNALKIYQQVYEDNHPKMALVLNNLALQYDSQENYTEALEKLNHVAKIWDAIYLNDHPSKAFANFSIGNVYYHQKEFEKALQYEEKALEMYKALYGDKHPEIANIYNLEGSIHMTQGHFKEAIMTFQKAIYANLSDQVFLTVYDHADLEGYYNADILLNSLLQKAKAFSDYHYNKSLKFKDLSASLSTLEIADELVSHMRQIRLNEKDKLALGATASEIYETGVSLAVSMSEVSMKPSVYLSKAFDFAEKSKSAVLLSAIQDTNAKEFSGIPKALLEEESALKANVSLAEQKLASNTDVDLEATIKSELLSLNNQYNAFVKKLEVDFPNYYNLKFNVKHASVKDLQQVLNAKTAVITHFLSPTRVYTFYISKEKMRVKHVAKNEQLAKKILALRNAIKYDVKDAFVQASTLLYDQLLDVKIESDIDQLAIIPEGELATIPFEVLMEEEKDWLSLKYSQMPYLIKKYKVSYDNSATLYLQRSQEINAYQGESEDIMLFAPVDFQKHQYFGISQAMSDLPGTVDEINEIDYLFKGVGGSPKVFVREQANKSSLLNDELKRYKYLHFATHGLVNESEPSLSRIFLSPDGSKDGSLFSGEIYNMNINADLVCLSACETGLGKVSKGEGIVGLSRALLYAGAKNMVVSLWSVSDESTSRLMVDFYNQHLNFSDHKTFSAALRKAKLGLLNEEKYSRPYYWAPFILIGE